MKASPLKPRRGRPPVAAGGKRILCRIDLSTLAALTEWRRRQANIPDESTAVRTLLQKALRTNRE